MMGIRPGDRYVRRLARPSALPLPDRATTTSAICRSRDQDRRAARDRHHRHHCPRRTTECSGLEVRRYDERSRAAELGESFALVKAVRKARLTPWGAEQRFAYASFRKLAPAPV